MKKKYVLIPLLLALLILVSCGGKEIYKDHPAMGKWNGHEASALSMSKNQKCEYSRSFNGRCTGIKDEKSDYRDPSWRRVHQRI